MKYTWEIKDIEVGKIVCREESLAHSKPDGWDAKWTYKIGWFAPGNEKRPYTPLPKNLNRLKRQDYIEENRADYALICMGDGMISKLMTKKEIMDRLNKDKMIPAPISFVIPLMEFCNRCFNK